MSTFGSGPFGRQRVNPLDYGSQAGSPALISFFNAVYAWMAAGLALTAVIAWWMFEQRIVFSRGEFILLLIVELALVLGISSNIRRINAAVATVMFLVYAALNGVMLSAIFFAYPMATIASAFVACAVMFGVMSIFGMVTKTDLSGLGRILFMGLIGVIVASVVNMFMHSNMVSWIVSYVGVAVFVGLTAYDTQKLKQIALSTAGDATLASRLSITGALMLYLDFLNLFLFLLQILGNRRSN